MLVYEVNFYGEKRIIQLPPSSTLRLLKLKIFEVFQIVPNMQLLIGLEQVNDAETLCDINDIQLVLVLLITEDLKDYAELCALYSFCNTFTGLPTKLMKIKDLLNESEKPVLLYLYTGQTNEFLNDVTNYENSSNWKDCELVIWNVSRPEYHARLQTILNEATCNMDDLITSIIKITEESQLLLLLPKSRNPFFSVINQKQLNCSNVKMQIMLARNLNNENLKKIRFMDNAANAFHQMMAVNLADRDYDCFEADQINLLKYKIAYAFFGPPNEEESTATHLTSFDFDDKIDIYGERKVKFIENALDKILKHNNMFSKHKNKVVLRVIYNVTEPLPEEVNGTVSQSDIAAHPIFVLRKCKKSAKPCCIYIDHELRVYQSFAKYIKNVKLPKRVMVLPRNGKYMIQADTVVLDRYYSPSCKLGSKVLEATDVGSSIVGILSGGALLIGTMASVAVPPVGIAVAVTATVASGIYGMARGVHSLVDRAEHDEDMSFGNSEARNAYLNIIAGTMSFTSAAAVQGLTVLASRGIQVPKLVQHVANALNLITLASSAAALGSNVFDLIYDFINNQKTPTPFAIIQLSTSILFFGHSVYSFRFASTIISEAQSNVIKTYSSDLSRKQRKMLNKVLKETTRLSPSVEHGRAEVIRAIRTTSTPNELFKFMSKHNRTFNRAGVRFSLSDGKIMLNGVAIDMDHFNSMSSTDMNNFLSELPTIPAENISVSSQLTSQNISNHFEQLKKACCIISTTTTVVEKAANLFRLFAENVQRKLCDLTFDIVMEICESDMPFIQTLNSFDRQIETVLKVAKIVLNFFQEQASNYVEDYNRKREEASRRPDFDQETFDNGYFCLPVNCIKALRFVEMAIMSFETGPNGLKTLISYIYTVVARKLADAIEQNLRRENRAPTSKTKSKCKTCNGHYYSA